MPKLDGLQIVLDFLKGLQPKIADRIGNINIKETKTVKRCRKTLFPVRAWKLYYTLLS